MNFPTTKLYLISLPTDRAALVVLQQEINRLCIADCQRDLTEAEILTLNILAECRGAICPRGRS